MTRRTVLANGKLLDVAFCENAPRAERLSALATGLARDELTESPIEAALRVDVREPRIAVNYGADGAFSLVARPWLRLPPLLAASYDVHLHIGAGGYAPLDLTVTVPSRQRSVAAPAPAAGDVVVTLNDASAMAAGQRVLLGPSSLPAERRDLLHTGPGAQEITLDGGLVNPRSVGDPVVADAWKPVDLGVVDLRREPLLIHGRAVRRNALTNVVTPVANADLVLTDFWWTLAAFRAQQPGLMTQANPALRAFALSVTPGLYASRAKGVGQIATLGFTTSAIDDRLLADAAVEGSAVLRVSRRHGLAKNDVVRVDADAPDRAEILHVADLTGFGTDERPGDVALDAPTRRAHSAGVRVQRIVPLPPGVARTFRREAAPGDACVFVDSVAGLAAPSDARVAGGPAPDEYQRVAPLSARSDADGYFSFPLVQRIAALALNATAPPLTALDLTFQPDYSRRENWIDLVFA